MNVLVDTPVWSFALRRREPRPQPHVRELAALITEGRAILLGAVRQELLSGIKSIPQFDLVRDHLREFRDLSVKTPDYEEAAAYFNRCRSRRIQGSNTDLLICAVAARRGLAIYTTDDDFRSFAKVLPIELHAPRK